MVARHAHRPLLGTHTGRFNRRHQLFSHLFSGRYKALIVDGSGNGYLRTVCDYVPLNPARAKLLRPEHYGQERQESDVEKAERVVREELKWRRWTEEALARRAKRDAGKLKIAARLRAETAVTVKWIAARLQLGTPGHLHHLLYGQRKVHKQ